MKNPVPVAEFESTECHCHPTFYVRRQENKGAVFNDHFQVRVKELENEI